MDLHRIKLVGAHVGDGHLHIGRLADGDILRRGHNGIHLHIIFVGLIVMVASDVGETCQRTQHVVQIPLGHQRVGHHKHTLAVGME